MADGDDPHTVAGFDAKVAGAFARNGLNTLLLDIKTDLATVAADLRHVLREQDDARDSRRSIHLKLDEVGSDLAGIKPTVARIAPLVDQSEARYQQQIGQGNERRRLLGFVTRGRVLGAGAITLASGSGLGLWHKGDVALHWLRVKLGL